MSDLVVGGSASSEVIIVLHSTHVIELCSMGLLCCSFDYQHFCWWAEQQCCLTFFHQQGQHTMEGRSSCIKDLHGSACLVRDLQLFWNEQQLQGPAELCYIKQRSSVGRDIHCVHKLERAGSVECILDRPAHHLASG